jgi:hypothetical protein
MAQQANVTLNTIVYAPAGTSNGVSKWTNRSGGFGGSFTNITEKFVTPTKGDVNRVEFALDVPIVQAADSECACAGTVLRTSTVHISVWVPSSSTAAERLDLFNRIRDLAASAPFVAAIENLDPSYG